MRITQNLRELWRKISEKSLDIIALFVAAVAVWITYRQGQDQKEMQISNTRPFLVIEFLKADQEPKKGFLISNVGSGPALIKSFKYYLNDSDYRNGTSHSSWIPEINDNLEFCFQKIQVLTKNSAIKDFLFLLETDGKTTLRNDSCLSTSLSFFNSRTAAFMSNLIIEIEYKSIYSVDSTTYYLRFCENYQANNLIREDAEYSYEEPNQGAN